jgi:hypothetical protein
MIQLSDVLKAIGPNASIVFAAWIFMGFPQQRYDAAIDRYRAAVGDYRSEAHDDSREAHLKDQLLEYRYRCRLMAWSTMVGLVSAMLLIAALIFGAMDVIFPRNAVITGAGIASSMIGFLLVIVAAFIVLMEGLVVRRQVDDELTDVPDLDEAVRDK